MISWVIENVGVISCGGYICPLINFILGLLKFFSKYPDIVGKDSTFIFSWSNC